MTMANNFRTPGVYIEEVSKFPPSVVAVETAIPAFIGYTAKTRSKGTNLLNRPVAVNSMLEFDEIFGSARSVGGFVVTVDADGKVIGGISDPNAGTSARFRMAYSLRHFYDNGGGRCYVVSIGDYTASAVLSDMVSAHLAGLSALATEDEPTLIVFPDLSAMAPSDASPAAAATVRAKYHSVLMQALNQCATLGDRFLICDLLDGDQAGKAGLEAFRNGIGTRNLKYGAVYHPFIQTTLPWLWDPDTITVTQLALRKDDGTITQPSPYNGMTLAKLKSGDPNNSAIPANPTIYANISRELDRYSVVLPPAAAIAGVYTTVDNTRGVWKSPANESLASVRALTVDIDKDMNDELSLIHISEPTRPY